MVMTMQALEPGVGEGYTWTPPMTPASILLAGQVMILTSINLR
jgi:hypothetical protein